MKKIRWIALLSTVTLLFECNEDLCAQQLNISLSQKHLAKIEKIKSPEKKIKKYRKFYTKDSIKVFKQADRFLEHWSDSVGNAAKEKKQKWEEGIADVQKGLTDKVSGKANTLAARANVRESEYKLPKELEKDFSTRHLQALYAFMRYYLTELRADTLQLKRLGLPTHKVKSIAGTDRLKQRVNINDLGIEDPRNEVTVYKTQVKSKLSNHKYARNAAKQSKRAAKYAEQAKAYKQLYGTLPTTKDGIIDFGETKLMTLVSQRNEVQELEKLKAQYGTANPWENEYKTKADQLQDTTYLKEEARRKAEELAIQYLQDNPSIVQDVQKKMTLLMNKYSIVPNSNDLNSAVKHSSLEDKPFKQRLHIATNFQVISLEPVSIDFAPALGYKINRYFVAGVGGTYRETFSKDKAVLSPNVVGYKGFLSYDLVHSFFAYGEYANNSPGVERTEFGEERIWKQALLVGIGRKFPIHTKMEMTCVFVYNFFHVPNDPVYPRPFMVRVGFQFSEQGLLKK